MSADTPPTTDATQDAPQDICDRTFRFAIRIIHLCQVLERTPGVSRNLAHQLLKSGTSVGTHVEEAQRGPSRDDFISQYSLAGKDLRETTYWIRLLGATNIIPPTRLNDLLDESQQIHDIITTTIANSRDEGP